MTQEKVASPLEVFGAMVFSLVYGMLESENLNLVSLAFFPFHLFVSFY